MSQGQGPHINESWHAYTWVMRTHINVSCQTYGWVHEAPWAESPCSRGYSDKQRHAKCAFASSLVCSCYHPPPIFHTCMKNSLEKRPPPPTHVPLTVELQVHQWSIEASCNTHSNTLQHTLQHTLQDSLAVAFQVTQWTMRIWAPCAMKLRHR